MPRSHDVEAKKKNRLKFRIWSLILYSTPAPTFLAPLGAFLKQFLYHGHYTMQRVWPYLLLFYHAESQIFHFGPSPRPSRAWTFHHTADLNINTSSRWTPNSSQILYLNSVRPSLTLSKQSSNFRRIIKQQIQIWAFFLAAFEFQFGFFIWSSSPLPRCEVFSKQFLSFSYFIMRRV